MKKSVILIVILLALPFVYADAIPVVDQCFGDCPKLIKADDFIEDFNNFKSQLEYITLPFSVSALVGNQKINIHVEDKDFIFGITTKYGKLVDIRKQGYTSPSMAVSLDARTLTSITTAYDPLQVIESAIANNRIIIEGETLFSKARAFTSKAYSLFATPEQYFELNPFACMDSSSERVVLQSTSFDVKIPKGNEVIIPPFKAQCTGNFNTKISVPQNYIDIQLLKCKDSVCTSLEVEQIETLDCGEDIVKVYRKEQEFDLSEIGISSERKVLLKGSNISSGRVELNVLNTDESISLKLSSPDKNIQQPKNPSLKILGAPVIINSDNSAIVNLKMPYISDPEIDPDSVGIYILKGTSWEYLGGMINKQDLTVSKEILLSSGEETFALLGQICINCVKPALERVYDPLSGTKDALILVHGLGVSPATYQDVIDDIRQTQQPFQAWTFGYPYKDHIEKNAKQLAENIEFNIKEFENIYLIGHSLGGVIIQEALNYAEKNKLGSLDKIRKVILVSVPNSGTISEGVLKELLDILVNSNIPGWFDINNAVVKDLVKGRLINRVSGIEYLVIAGTHPYEFTTLLGVKEKNDGIVPVNSAQNIGGLYVNNRCDNYWEIDSPHTLLVEHPDARNILEKIVSTEVRKDITDRALLGNQQYFEINLPYCPEEALVVVGKHVTPQKSPDKVCGCGNGYCGVDENKISCPSDCANIFRKEFYCAPQLKWGLLLGFILLLISTYFVDKKIKNYSARYKSFLVITCLAAIAVIVLIAINLVCVFNNWLFAIELLLALIFARKLWNLWKNPVKLVI